MWKFLNESVEGSSHKQSAINCQDASFVTPYNLDGEQLLILTCADGAGSAPEAAAGAKLACSVAAQQAVNYFDGGHEMSELDEPVFHGWATAVHDALDVEAKARGITARDMACTLLLAVVGQSAAAFIQIGDGAIVVRDDDRYQPIFWPQNGEYQNTTYFITDLTFAERVQVQRLSRPVDELALFTDGLQMLALNHAARTVHKPFFTPLFVSLRKVGDRDDLIIPMRQFLNSKAINDRTDDDKTLVLATRGERCRREYLTLQVGPWYSAANWVEAARAPCSRSAKTRALWPRCTTPQ